MDSVHFQAHRSIVRTCFVNRVVSYGHMHPDLYLSGYWIYLRQYHAASQ